MLPQETPSTAPEGGLRGERIPARSERIVDTAITHTLHIVFLFGHSQSRIAIKLIVLIYLMGFLCLGGPEGGDGRCLIPTGGNQT